MRQSEATPHPAPCHGAGRLLFVAVAVTLLTGAAVAGDLWCWSRHRNDRPAAWLQLLQRTTPALWPAGTVRRHPETRHPAVDLRFGYGLEELR